PPPILLTAKTPTALRKHATTLADHLEAHPGLAASDVAATLLRRARLEHGAAVDAEGEDLVAALRALSRDEVHDALITGRKVRGGTVFVFPGQGAQWTGMARELLRRDPVFRAEIESCAEAFAPHTGWSLTDVLLGADGAPSLERVDVVQPALFAVMVSLAAMWQAAGVRPDAVAGHSQGEIAAAYVAGALSLEDAAALVTLRSLAVARIAGDGGMVSVALGAEELAPVLAGLPGELEIAVRNGPRRTVVAGAADALGALLSWCDEQGVRARRIPVDYASHSRHVEPLEEHLLETFAGLKPRPARTAFYSSVTGEQVDTGTLDAAYWYANLRGTVQFEAAANSLIDAGHRMFIEVSPHPVLTVPIEEILGERGATGLACGTLRRDEGGPDTFRRALAVAHLGGAPVTWAVAPAPPVDLPTYPFERTRYWLTPTAGQAGTTRLGLAAAHHPLLGAMVTLADGGTVLTGRLDLAAHEWLTGHRVFRTTLLPGTAFAELASHAGNLAGCPRVRELTVRTPMRLTPGRPAQTQVTVDAPDEDGQRRIDMYSRTAEDEPWTHHATGVLDEGNDPAPSGPVTEAAGSVAVPAGAEPVDVTDLYERLYRLGYDYGPAFRGLTGAWRAGETIYVEITATGPDQAGSQDFTVHPAMLDAALHPVVAGLTGPADPDPGRPLLPFVFEGLRLAGRADRVLRARIDPLPGARFRYLFADEAGEPVGAATVAFRPAGRAELTGARDETYRIDWEPVTDPPPGHDEVVVLGGFGDIGALVDLGDPATPVADDLVATRHARTVLVPVGGRTDQVDGRSDEEGGRADEVIAQAHERAAAVLGLLRSHLRDPASRDTRLTVVTAEHDLASAPIRGLVRTAAAEHPGRFGLVTVDGPAPIALLAAGHGERETAVREAALFAPRLVPAELADPPRREQDGSIGATVPATGGTDTTEPATGGTDTTVPATGGTGATEPVTGGAGATVLVTGGTGALGALVARRLAAAVEPPHLLLVSRGGAEAPGAAELAGELRAAGAEVTVAACDVTDRAALAAVIASIPQDRPLRSVVHAAGVLADATVGEMDVEELAAVLRPKVDAAWHLHELTAGLPLESFVLFSSAVATLGVPGQANYAAGNTFLDALAAYRRAAGLPATAIAWGLWHEAGAMTGHLGDADRARLARYGVGVLDTGHALDVLERVRDPHTVVSPLDEAVLRQEAVEGRLPALLSRIVTLPPAVRRAEAGGAWMRRLGAEPRHEWPRVLTALVREQAAAVLDHRDPDRVSADRPLTELGLDSLTAVELRNRLATLSGLSLPATVVFEFPTVAALATRLLDGLTAAEPAKAAVTTVAAGPADDDPVVIVGMACRLPGGVTSPQELWDLVASGTDATGDFPDDRGWDVDALYHPDPDHKGTTYTRRGGFLYDAAEFDAEFFGMSPREALATDPQQRLLLQVAWEALERAGIDPTSLKESDTGVFIGAMYDDYATRLRTVPEELEGMLLAGNESSVASGRIAYVLGLQGPALTVDTACSSSLVALDLAVRAVRSGQCTLALAGGAAIMATPG
ncbi:type I polyketide synthase, partial [Sphaerisporangium sp. B11E5]|uniref:type I polyketide synthase n=1 Tax=Sphaerisporangium sp. B11E5 TaxID=3153563 RepID=UPI00325EC3F0